MAEVSESHGYENADIYLKKSNARNHSWSEKFVKILLRMSDLLDMSNHRVSKVILNHNIANMGKTSRFHWISHILTRGHKLDVKYDLNDKKERNILQRDNIIETITMTVIVDLPQTTQVKSLKCKDKNLKSIDGNILSLECGEACNCEKCNFLCKWFSKKNKDLFSELEALEKYLNSVPNNYYKTKLEVKIETTNNSVLSQEQFSNLTKYVEGEEM